MIVRIMFALCLAVVLCSACGPGVAPTPAPTATPTPAPTVVPHTPTGVLVSQVSDHYAPAAVPACKDVQALDKPVAFSWPGIEDIAQNAPESNWTYYRCGEPASALAAFYRYWMPDAHYHWAEELVEQQAAGTMAGYFTNTGNPADPNRWLYLWFLPDPSSEQASYLVAVWWVAPKSC